MRRRSGEVRLVRARIRIAAHAIRSATRPLRGGTETSAIDRPGAKQRAAMEGPARPAGGARPDVALVREEDRVALGVEMSGRARPVDDGADRQDVEGQSVEPGPVRAARVSIHRAPAVRVGKPPRP